MFIDKRCYEIARQKHYCPHCKTQLSCCHTPPYHVGDGLGWGTEIFFICLNNDCPLFNRSWKEFEDNYGQRASCRYMLLPNEKKGGPMMVGSSEAFTGCVVDLDKMDQQNERLTREKEAVEQLATCVEEKNLKPLITLITDEEASLENRQKACDLLEIMNDLECIDPLRAHKFVHTEFGQQAELAICRILKKQNRMECGFCAEIIKSNAKICKHCKREVSGDKQSQ